MTFVFVRVPVIELVGGAAMERYILLASEARHSLGGEVLYLRIIHELEFPLRLTNPVTGYITCMIFYRSAVLAGDMRIPFLEFIFRA